MNLTDCKFIVLSPFYSILYKFFFKKMIMIWNFQCTFLNMAFIALFVLKINTLIKSWDNHTVAVQLCNRSSKLQSWNPKKLQFREVVLPIGLNGKNLLCSPLSIIFKSISKINSDVIGFFYPTMQNSNRIIKASRRILLWYNVKKSF